MKSFNFRFCDDENEVDGEDGNDEVEKVQDDDYCDNNHDYRGVRL